MPLNYLFIFLFWDIPGDEISFEGAPTLEGTPL